MSTIKFQYGHIWNNGEYRGPVYTQSRPLAQEMGKQLSVVYATVNEAAAKDALAKIGFSLRSKSHVDTMTSINSSTVDNQVSGMVNDFFEEPIEVVHGVDIFMALMQQAIDGSVSSFTDHFFTSSSRSEGTYFSYQLTFYSLKKASFCYLVLSFVAFKESSSVFGFPTSFRSGISYKAQIFECKKIYNNVLYNFGVLKSGEAMGSPNGTHKGNFGTDGNFSVGSRWQTNTAGKGKSPWTLVMQEDANLVLYDADGKATWASGSQPGRFSEGPYRLELQDDGNLVIYDSRNTALWSIGQA